MNYSNHRIQDLVQTIINDGDVYPKRLETGRCQKSYPQFAATAWVNIAKSGARKFENQLQPDERFSAQDILETAIHLSTETAQHLAEF